MGLVRRAGDRIKPVRTSKRKFIFDGLHSCLNWFLYEIINFIKMNPITLLFLISLFFMSLFSPAWANPDAELQKIKSALDDFVPYSPAPRPKILVYSKASGFAHKSIPTGVKALRALAEKTLAFEPYFSTSAEDLTFEKLNGFDGVIFNNTTRVEKAFLSPEQRDGLLKFIKQGNGFTGFHGASDAGMPKWAEYTRMIGGCFDGHPWNAGGTWPFTVEDPNHPLCKSFSSNSFIFQWR